MKRQQTNLRSSPDSEATGIKHTMVRWGTIVHKINELPCCRFHHIKWGCLLQNKKHKTFFVKNFTFLHLEDTRWNFHSGKTPHEKKLHVQQYSTFRRVATVLLQFPPELRLLTLSLPQVTKREFLLRQAGDENREEYQLWDYLLIQHQILWTNIIRIVWQIVWRITN